MTDSLETREIEIYSTCKGMMLPLDPEPEDEAKLGPKD